VLVDVVQHPLHRAIPHRVPTMSMLGVGVRPAKALSSGCKLLEGDHIRTAQRWRFWLQRHVG
jgi:hypothetical protein